MHTLISKLDALIGKTIDRDGEKAVERRKGKKIRKGRSVRSGAYITMGHNINLSKR